MKKIIDFKTRYNNLAHEVKILTSHKKASREQRTRYFLILSDYFIKTYSYLNELRGREEYTKYLKRLYDLRDVITKYGLDIER